MFKNLSPRSMAPLSTAKVNYLVDSPYIMLKFIILNFLQYFIASCLNCCNMQPTNGLGGHALFALPSVPEPRSSNLSPSKNRIEWVGALNGSCGPQLLCFRFLSATKAKILPQAGVKLSQSMQQEGRLVHWPKIQKVQTIQKCKQDAKRGRVGLLRIFPTFAAVIVPCSCFRPRAGQEHFLLRNVLLAIAARGKKQSEGKK